VLDKIMAEGAEKASTVANEALRQVMQRVGLT